MAVHLLHQRSAYRPIVRFVSEERREPPDIDVDFEHERREEVIQWIYETYVTAALAGLIWAWSDEGVGEVEARDLNLNLSDRRLKLTLELASQLIGTPRHLSQHPGGFVLTQDRLDDLVPIEPAAMENWQVIEWDKDDIDTLRFMKVDVLGLGMLGCMRRCFDLLAEHKGVKRDLATVPPEDEATYEMIRNADTVGCATRSSTELRSGRRTSTLAMGLHARAGRRWALRRAARTPHRARFSEPGRRLDRRSSARCIRVCGGRVAPCGSAGCRFGALGRGGCVRLAWPRPAASSMGGAGAWRRTAPPFAAADKRRGSLRPEVEEERVELAPMTAGREVVEDYRSRGLTLRSHPVAFLRGDLAANGYVPAGDLSATRDGRRVSVAGLVLVRQRPGSANGVLFVTLEDETDIANLIIWPSLFERQRRLVLSASMIGCRGKVQREGQVIHVIAEHLTDLSALLGAVGEREEVFPLPYGRGNEAKHGSGPGPRNALGRKQGDIYIPDLRIEGAIAVKTRDFR